LPVQVPVEPTKAPLPFTFVQNEIGVGPNVSCVAIAVTWLFAGDSITQGAVHTRGFRDYTQLFKERLGELGRNEDVVINSAVGGWTLADLESRLEERILRFRPHAVFVMFGTNDAALGEEELRPFAKRMEAVVSRLREAGVSLIIQTPPAMWPADPERYGVLIKAVEPERSQKIHRLRTRYEFLPRLVDAIRAVSVASKVPLVDHWETWGRIGVNLGQLTDGAFHPNEYGHRVIAHKLFKDLGIYDPNSWTCRLFTPTDIAM